MPSHFLRLKIIQLAIASRDSNDVVRGWSVDNFCTSFRATGARELVDMRDCIVIYECEKGTSLFPPMVLVARATVHAAAESGSGVGGCVGDNGLLCRLRQRGRRRH